MRLTADPVALVSAHIADPANWVNKWRIGILTLAVFAALC